MMTAGMILGAADQVRKANARWKAEVDRLRRVYAAQGKTYDPGECHINDIASAQELAVAIVREAARTYEETLICILERRGASRGLLNVKAEHESFFLSQDFEMYMPNTDGKRFMKQIQKNAAQKAKQKARKRMEDAEKKIEKSMRNMAGVKNKGGKNG